MCVKELTNSFVEFYNMLPDLLEYKMLSDEHFNLLVKNEHDYFEYWLEYPMLRLPQMIHNKLIDDGGLFDNYYHLGNKSFITELQRLLEVSRNEKN